ADAGRVAAAGRAAPPASSNDTCTGRSYHSVARVSILCEKFLRTQSSLKRLGADTRSAACVSSNASGTKGRIQALSCCGGRSCSSRWTQVCQKSFVAATSVTLESTLLAPKLSTGKTGRTLGICAKHLTKHQKF